MNRLKLGQLLVESRLVSASALSEILELQKTDKRRLGELLVERKLVTETQLTQVLSHQLSIPWVSLLHIEFSRALLDLVPRELAERYCLVPIYVRKVKDQGDTLYVAMDDPTDDEGIKACEKHAGLPVRGMIAQPSDIKSAIRVYYGGSQTAFDRAKITDAPPTRHLSRPSSAVTAIPEGDDQLIAPEIPRAPATPQLGLSSAAHRTSPQIEEEITVDVTFDAGAETGTARNEAEHVRTDRPKAPKGKVPPRDVASSQLKNTVPAARAEATPKKARKTISMTLLDGTTVAFPTGSRGGSARRQSTDPPAMTAHDLVAALRLASHDQQGRGDVADENARWEAYFAALLSLLLKKHLIADWEFVEELNQP